MESEPRSATGHINRGIAFHARGEIDAAREQFAEAILDDPANEHAWLWLAETCDDPAEQRYCLDRALKLNPDSAARARQAELAAVKGVVPPVVADVDKHPLPPSLAPREHPMRARIRSLPGAALAPSIRSRSTQAFRGRWWVWALPGLALLLLAGWLLVTRPWESDQPWVVAVVGPMTGPEAGVGTEMVNGAELALDMIAVDQGPRIDLVVFDTQDDPDRAEATARQIVADDRFVAVIDFGSSTASLAAAPIYSEAGLAVISGRASLDALEQYPAHFRLTVNTSTEGALLAQYVAFGLDYDRASVIVGPGSYEQAISEAFSTQFAADGAIAHTWTLASDQRDASIAAIVQGLEQSSDPGIVLLALREADAHDVLLAVRRAGLTPIMIGTEPQSTEDFGRLFANEPEEQATPGFFTENLYAAVPILYDGIGGDAVAVALRYQQVYGTEPGWRAAKGYDAALVVYSTIQAGRLEHDTAADRAQVIANLHAIGNPDVALRGISGPLYFNERGFVPQGLSLGEFVGGRFVSAPIQYRLVTDPGQFDLEAELASGDAFQLGGDTFREYRVVYVGVEMIELRDLQVTRQTYAADFFVYFRYFGDDKVVNVVFTNATSDLHLAEPLVTKTDATGMTYKLYRVQGEFGDPMDFSDYPWDEHLLTIRLQNRTEEDTELLYVPDPAIVASSQAERQGSGFDLSRPFDQIPSWHVAFVDFAHVSITAASDDYDSPTFVRYSEFRVLLDIERDIGKFLVKNLLPLAMLTVMTYISMWFPPEEARTRTTFSITALLTAAVMLNTISSRLPDIGYTVAIEWGFYAFIGVVALLALLNMAVLHSFRAKHFARVKRLDTCIRIFFPVAVLSTIAVYVVKFG